MINQDLINKIKNKERTLIPIENIELQHSLKLLNLQKDSCKNLFTSYVNATTEAANNFNLEKFLEKYFSYELKFQDTILLILHQNLGKEFTDEILYGENRRVVNIVNDYKELMVL